jgi:hypothetical protein
MVLDGVSLDDRVVHDLTAIVARPLSRKLEQARQVGRSHAGLT